MLNLNISSNVYSVLFSFKTIMTLNDLYEGNFSMNSFIIIIKVSASIKEAVFCARNITKSFLHRIFYSFHFLCINKNLYFFLNQMKIRDVQKWDMYLI